MNAIFAVDSIDGFGVDNTLPWPYCSVDMKRFKALTTNNTVVMGSGTWNSNMPKPLPNRRNCVLSSTLEDDRCEVFRTINDLMMNLSADETVFVIGGAKTLWMLRSFINRVYLTRFKTVARSTVILTTDTYLEGFKLVSSEEFSDHTLDIYERA